MEESLVKSGEDLSIYVPETSLDGRLRLEAMLGERTRLNTDFWLIDISLWKSVKNASSILKGLKLDLDDDVYFYMFNKTKTSMEIWEVYKIHENQSELSVLPYNEWSAEIGFYRRPEDKWVRRRDLKVIIKIFCKIFSLINFLGA